MKSLAGHQAVLVGVAVFVGGVVVGLAAAQSVTSDITTAQDCLGAYLDASDDASLTREERIAKLDKVLLESLNNSDLCQSVGSAMTDGVAGGVSGGVAGGAGDGVAGGSAGSGSAGAVESLPSGDIQGADSTAESRDSTQTQTQTQTAAGKPEVGADVAGPDSSAPNGKAPDDIPPAENDDIIAKQFRQAAVEETDPEAQAKLWNEYRRYKGLPVKEAPEPNASDAKP